MTPKERIAATIAHREPDKVPAHINATKWVVEKLKTALKVKSDKALLEALHIDVYDMRGIDIHTGTAPKYIGPENEFFPANWAGAINSFWRIREFENKTDSGWNMEMDAPPLTHAATLEEMMNYPWPDNYWFEYSDLRDKLEYWKDFSIMASGASVFQHATYLRGMDTLMMDMMAYPEAANFVLDKFTDFYFEYYRRMFEVAGDLIDVFALADDFGMQNTLLISPEMFDEFVAPRLKKMADLAHSYNIKLLLHTCGNVESLIPRFIELGVDILDPIQPESMDPIAIKKKYGNDICLRGGISVQNVVSRGTVEEVKAETKRIVEALKPGGGYIFSPGHPVLQDDIPVENIVAMYETGFKYGVY
ncbi:MAG: uroporphyrinogen decarboxylase family protein [Prolixibacteraceae bacterium]|nr:uroporphyrinogen decarboxylase family protein [Prolixibacteraceae bacterium]